MILGSFIVTILSALIATFPSIGAAVFMTEGLTKGVQKILQPAIELLVGIPSVVYGFIGLQLWCLLSVASLVELVWDIVQGFSFLFCHDPTIGKPL